ncbi:hypothetical protein GRI38_06040 [Altererythrobacter aurantiacus]|uniref:PepSY domain-containing protein n=1 Tax=Parapontixanthobacter aurantiacus TaxID=1463599 RepID=A0A844ZF14_9SPHN|nr:hypothetical protein [Parapontixanthobacter aurantiacus]MXO85587.1 hypothetical protein [Parapontixanthobacter aurantiacus]
MSRFVRFAAAPAMIAAVSLGAPSYAASLPLATGRAQFVEPAAWTDDAQTVEGHRHRYRDRYYHRRNRVDAGDVIAGVAILGTIAAIASAVRKDRNERVYRERDVRYRDWREPGYEDSRGLDGAAELCVREIERDARVSDVNAVERNATGWIVRGTLFDGSDFTCSIDADGDIENIDYSRTDLRAPDYDDDGFAAVDRGNQWDDERYAEARANALVEGPHRSEALSSDPVRDEEEEVYPAYPGGPLPGETFDDEDDVADEQPIDGDLVLAD